MTKKPPPVPPTQRSHEGTGGKAPAPTDTSVHGKKANAPQNLEEEGSQGNRAQNTSNRNRQSH